MRNKETGKIVKAHRHQMKAFIDSGSYEVVSLEERAEIEAAEADARPLYKDARGIPVYGK